MAPNGPVGPVGPLCPVGPVWPKIAEFKLVTNIELIGSMDEPMFVPVGFMGTKFPARAEVPTRGTYPARAAANSSGEIPPAPVPLKGIGGMKTGNSLGLLIVLLWACILV